VKFNKKNTGIFTRKRKRKIPIICQKISEISPGKKPLVPSSPPQNILGSTLCGVWDVPDFWNVLYWALIPGFRGILMVQKDKTF